MAKLAFSMMFITTFLIITAFLASNVMGRSVRSLPWSSRSSSSSVWTPSPCVTEGSLQCKFPFKYNGRLFHSCTSTRDLWKWCATSVHNETLEMTSSNAWDYCGDSCLAPCTGENSSRECVFPFVHEGIEYNGCIDAHADADTDTAWCSGRNDEEGMADSSYKQRCRKDLCPLSTSENCKTISGNDPLQKCSFPFFYNGKSYEACKMDENGNWCSTKTFLGIHVPGYWGICDALCPVRVEQKLTNGNQDEENNDSA